MTNYKASRSSTRLLMQDTASIKYKTPILKEVFRKSIHICSCFVPFLLSLNRAVTLLLLTLAAALYCASEVCRMHGVEVPLISRITRAAARRKDEDSFALGPVMLVLGIMCASILYGARAARIGIYALAFGDGFASLAGKSFGKVKIPFMRGKTAAGSMACFIAVFLSSFFVGQDAEASLVLSFAVMITEMLPLGDMDNLFIPIVAGALSEVLLH